MLETMYKLSQDKLTNLKSVFFDHRMTNTEKDIFFLVKLEKDSTLTCYFANEIALQYMGLDETCFDKNMKEVFSKKRFETLENHLGVLLDSKSPVGYEEKIQLISGEIMQGDTTLTPIFEEDQCTYVCCVTHDVTSQKFEKELLNQSMLRYRALIDYNMDMIVTVNKDGTILHANPASTAMFGYCGEELENSSILELVDSLSINSFKEMLKNTLETGNAEVLKTCHFVHRNESQRIMNVRSIPIISGEIVDELYLIIRDVTKEEKKEKTIQYLAYNDALTGLKNRACFTRDMMRIISKKVEKRENLAIMYLDLDRFKFINDSLGHDVGDVILKETGERLECIVSEIKRVKAYRMGGDEFIITMNNVHKSLIEELAIKIIEVIKHPYIHMKEQFYLSTSIGISMYPEDGEELDLLIKKADLALYNVKRQNKGTYQFYEKLEVNTSLHIFNIEKYLRRAIVQKELIIHYQPQVNMDTKELIGLEALIRWNSKELGLISPNDFIPLAEEAECIIEVGNWVIEHVCEQMKIWNDKGYPIKKIAINLSPLQVENDGVVETLKYHLTKNNIKPEQFMVEITEGTMKNRQKVLSVLHKIKELGIGISVDDFGTGYSSLSYLKTFPIDMLKIDRSFIQEIGKDKKEDAITTTIIYMAKQLGLEIIAEGVEKTEQIEFLKEQECVNAQGFYFSKPITNMELEKLFFDNKECDR